MILLVLLLTAQSYVAGQAMTTCMAVHFDDGVLQIPETVLALPVFYKQRDNKV